MRLTILVADDDPGTRLSISDYLEMSGYSVVAAENGQEALALVEEYQPHLMVTDITMPQMDGYELVRRVRQKPSFRLLPVVFLTARTDTRDRIRGYQLGCDLYLPKPFELDELGAVVRNLLERSQLIQTQMIKQQWQAAEQSAGAVLEAEKVGLMKTSDGPVEARIILTQREQEVLKLLAHGLSNAQIGDRLHLSPRTVEKHVSSLLRKSDANNRAELVHYAMGHDLIQD
ncbi:DNA-binding response regulator [Leptolyngbya sp. 'hensonii']|uniref:response regulator transcription factor n=1 Tax=Leptolyngbya sp. 'hensonii' TaxID=1922337 RepID=UPI00094F6D74|nr:response regulator transcription factor [Leptolyngbya sp. 'hensonii']OLP20158.1 DNA-binding response regulator [Leptolyngbya sp. 'hensonii']